MKSPKTLRKPLNWQDLETLCKKLWGEIWECAEIKKNGRTGQKQCGVDVYGIPKYESQYYGIQCKGKSEYNNKQFTIREIDIEIEKALLFKPKLKKLYLVTTAEKDVKIEEYIRIKNIESIGKGNFEVHIFSWEDVVELIEENRKTYQFYINSNNYKSQLNAEITFENNLRELDLEPRYIRKHVRYVQQIVPRGMFSRQKTVIYPDLNYEQMKLKKLISSQNLSYVPFSLRIKNTGNNQLENYKIRIELSGNILDTRTSDYTIGPESVNTSKEIQIRNSHLVEINPTPNYLVSSDFYDTDKIYIKSGIENQCITLRAKLLAKTYTCEEKLTINTNPTITDVHSTPLTKDPLKVGPKESTLAEMIIETFE